MADEAGNFYEVHGQHVRPLGELVSDERGRIFEVQPAREAQPTVTEHPQASASEPEHVPPPSIRNNGHRPETTAQPTSAQAKSNHKNFRYSVPPCAAPPPGDQSPGYNGVPPEGGLSRLEPAPVSSPDSSCPGGGSYRKIIADPGLYVKLPWAHVKGELAPHLQHPEQLRDDELLDCHAQIYVAQQTILAAQLAALALGDAAFASQLQPLTQAKAQMLGAVELFKPTHDPFEMRATHRQIYAGQRVYRLWPVFDPTVERDNTSGRPSTASEEKAATLRTQIPQQFLNPLQFTYSRDEVLYDMKGVLGALPPQTNALTRWLFIDPLRLLKVSRIVISSGRRLKKWHAMLKGKTPDEQLWAVTPPRGFFYHPTVRRWAEEMLTQAGYDRGRMLVEWEIFWRRKGWN